MLKRPMMAAMLALSVVLAGCGDSNDPDADPVVGQWIGTYGIGGTTTTGYDYQFVFFANGTMRAMTHHDAFDAETDAVGTWERDGSTVTGHFSYPGDDPYSMTGTLSATTGAAGTTLTGTWGSGTSTTDGGGFALTKQ